MAKKKQLVCLNGTLVENEVRQRLCTQKGTQVSRIFVTAKQGVYPQGDAEGGILEL